MSKNLYDFLNEFHILLFLFAFPIFRCMKFVDLKKSIWILTEKGQIKMICPFSYKPLSFVII